MECSFGICTPIYGAISNLASFKIELPSSAKVISKSEGEVQEDTNLRPRV